MDRSQRAPQLYAYGYIVCLIAVVTLLFSLNSLVRNAFDFANPNMSGVVTSSLMLLLAIVLFATHWLWLRGIRAEMA